MIGKNKYKMHKFGKDCYLLGQDSDGINYFLEAATWDCDWYWGGGYVETYTNNRNPMKAKDIRSHSHFDSMFFNGNGNGYDTFKSFFKVTPFTDKEIWKIIELMKSFYIARRYSDMMYTGGAHYTTNPAKEMIKSVDEYNRINTVVIPAIMEQLYIILGGENYVKD